MALGVGKSIYQSANAAFIANSVSPVVMDSSSGAVWTGWGAAQRDFFILGPDGTLIYRVNLTPGFDEATIDAVVQDALAALGGAASCSGDLDGSASVDVNDLLQLLSDFGSAASDSDINSDGVVDVNDLLGLLSAFGAECSGGGGGAAAPCAYGEDCGGQSFTSCGSMCPATCGTLPGMMCNEMCYNGFQCPNDQFWDENANGVGSGACVGLEDCSIPMPELPPGIAPGRPFLSAKTVPMFARAVEQAVSDWVGMVGPDGKHNHDGRAGGDYGQEEEF